MKLSLQIFVAVLLVSVSLEAGTYEKKINSLDAEAKCLDGSSPALLVHQGSEKDKILIYLMGERTCDIQGKSINAALDECARRTKTNEGSSKYWEAQTSADGLGILETDPALNKFASWTKIIIPHCDGSIFQGNNKDVVKHKGTDLYFRGSVNMRAHFMWIDLNYNLNDATKIVLAGSLIGGIATMIWIEQLRAMVTQPDKIYGIIDSGIVPKPPIPQIMAKNAETMSLKLGIPNALPPAHAMPPKVTTIDPTPISPQKREEIQAKRLNSFKRFIQITNKHESLPNKKCVQHYTKTNEAWKCYFDVYALEFTEAKFLWINSQYDKNVLAGIIGFQCITEGEFQYTLTQCNAQQIAMMDFWRAILIQDVLEPLVEKGHSVWSSACVWSAGLKKSDVYLYDINGYPAGIQISMNKAIESYVLEDKVVVQMDQNTWPSNNQCAF